MRLIKNSRSLYRVRLYLGIALVGTAFLLAVAPVSAATFYVSTNGNDLSNGSLATPYRTIQKAASLMVAGDTCFIRNGIYRETVVPANSGYSVNPITFTNYNGESALVSGLDVITNTWAHDSGSIYRITNPLVMGSMNQVFVQGSMAYEARWPNNTGSVTYFTTARPSANGSQSSNGNTNYLSNINLPFTNASDLKGASLWISPGLQWNTYIQPVVDYTPATKTIAYAAPVPGSTSWTAQTDDQFYIFGSKALLDADNEWWYDAGANVLYLQAPGGVDPGTLTVEVKAREYGFNLNSRNYITIGGLNLKGCRISASLSNGIKLQQLNCKYVAHNTSGSMEGIYLRGTSNEVRDCEIAYSSSSLLTLELSTGGKLVNNYVHDGDYLWTRRIFKAGGANLIVSHNTICNSPGNMIRLEMQGGVFQYNHVYNGCWAIRDCGLMYCNFIDGQNAVIQRNVFHDNLSESTNMSHGVYFDSSTSDFIFIRNIFYKNRMNGLKINTAFHHLVYNNTSYATSSYAVRYAGFNFSNNMADDRPDGTELANNIATCNNITTNAGTPVEHNSYSTRNLDPLMFDPAYVNSITYDLRLSPNSCAIGRGIVISGVTDGFNGSAPDLGALEYGQAMFKVGHDFTTPPDTNLLVLPDLKSFENRNLVVNGSFEYGQSPWILGDAGTLSLPNQSSSLGGTTLNGYYSAQLGPSVDSVSQIVSNLIPNMRYVASVWAKAQSGETAQFNVSGYGGPTLSVSSTATNWTPLDIWFTNGSSSATVSLQLKKSNAGSGYVNLDVCGLKRSPAPRLPIQFDISFRSNTIVTITNTAQYTSPFGSVTYTLLSAPTGASIDTNGIIRWQPNSSQIPGVYTFITLAKDAGIPALATSNFFTVTYSVPQALLYEGFVAGTNNAAGQYVANPGTDTTGRYKFIAGQSPIITGFVGDWIGLGGAQFELGVTPLSSLSYPGVITTGNAAYRQFTSGGSTRRLDVTNTFAKYNNGGGQIGKDGTTLYASFLMRTAVATNVGSLGFGSTSGTDGEARIQANGSNFVFRANYVDAATTVPTDTNTHLFVIKFQFDTNDTVTFWKDPSDLTLESNNSSVATLTTTNPERVEFSFLTLNRGTGSGSNGVLFDELRFATNWGDNLFVSTSAVTPLPGVPTAIAYTCSATNFILSWPTNYVGWILQAQTNPLPIGLSSNWIDIPASVSNSTWLVPLPGDGASFFRLRLP